MDVLFAVLPFADLNLPAIGVSLLNARIEQSGFSSQIKYFGYDLAERIGLDLYGALSVPSSYGAVATAAPTETLLGEWFFAEQVFGGKLPTANEYVSRFLAPDHHLGPRIPEILAARAELGDFVDAAVDTIRRTKPRVVGFSSVFCQTSASLAVAKRLKESADAPIVMFGGPNCAAEMGRQMIRSFPWIDYVCTGEGDDTFPELLENLLRRTTRAQVPGFLEQGGDDVPNPAPLVRDLDKLPFPDYASFFDRHRESPLRAKLEPRLSLETSRGCWWGAKHHCTFCGLNAEGMEYRAKSSDRVLAEIEHLSAHYQTTSIDCVDTILHMKYFDTLLPRLAERTEKLQLFYETKANLTLRQVQQLRDAGVWRIQPGVESFSDETLRLMRKGCTALQNIQLLRWCDEVGIFADYAILYGFPGESLGEYEKMAALIPQLEHLQPPGFVSPIRMDRFSPNFVQAEELNLVNVRPAAAYRYIFPLPAEELAELAYYFDFEHKDGRDPRTDAADVRHAVEHWAESHTQGRDRRPALDLLYVEGVALVNDTRACAKKPTHVLRDLELEIYMNCDVAQSVTSLAKKIAAEASRDQIEDVVEKLQASGLIAEITGKYLSLAVFRSRPTKGRFEPRVEVSSAAS